MSQVVWVITPLSWSRTIDNRVIAECGAINVLAERLAAAEGEAAQLRSAAQEARAAAAKLDADLEGLSGAYNSLEQHSFTLEARLRQLEEQGIAG